MGPEHLTRAAGVLAMLVACGGEPAPPPVVPVASTHHAQIVRAMTTPQRGAIIARFQERNGDSWQVNAAALASTAIVVDPFAGFLRHAWNALKRPPSTTRVTEEEAARIARAFVKKNADLLGLPHQIVPTLADHARAAQPEDHASPRAAWVIRLETDFPNKGYESFREMENKADLEVTIDDDGVPSLLSNVSRIHPRLTIDVKPSFGSDDGRLYAKLIGRRVFALTESGAQVQLGNVERKDFQRAQLVIFASPGPMMAWMTYRLAWGVGATKESPEGAPLYYFFTWIVDADSGEVVADAEPPLASQFAVEPP